MILYFRQFGKFFYVFLFFRRIELKNAKLHLRRLAQTERGIVSKSLALPIWLRIKTSAEA